MKEKKSFLGGNEKGGGESTVGSKHFVSMIWLQFQLHGCCVVQT